MASSLWRSSPEFIILSKDESVENFTLQRALELLATKEAAGGCKSSSKSNKSTKTAAAKSETATEKTAAKKTTAKKTATATTAKKTTKSS